MFDYVFDNPLFGICITLLSYGGGVIIYRKLEISLLHPVITSSVFILAVLLIFNIPIDYYQNGGSIISFLLGPATVVLAVPLYRQIGVMKKHALTILISITVGAVAAIISTIILSRAFNLPKDLILSLVPKSVTTPIAIEISERLGGLPAITALSVIFTGITGAVIGPWLLNVLRVTSPSAKGIALGTAAHAIGTSRAIEIGETEGAVSSLSIGLAGIITAAAAPFIVSIFSNWIK